MFRRDDDDDDDDERRVYWKIKGLIPSEDTTEKSELTMRSVRESIVESLLVGS